MEALHPYIQAAKIKETATESVLDIHSSFRPWTASDEQIEQDGAEHTQSCFTPLEMAHADNVFPF